MTKRKTGIDPSDGKEREIVCEDEGCLVAYGIPIEEYSPGQLTRYRAFWHWLLSDPDNKADEISDPSSLPLPEVPTAPTPAPSD